MGLSARRSPRLRAVRRRRHARSDAGGGGPVSARQARGCEVEGTNTGPLHSKTGGTARGVARRIEERGALQSAHRVLQTCGQIFRYGVATGRAERDPTADLRGALAPPEEVHLAAIMKPTEAGALLRAIDGYRGGLVVRCASLPTGVRAPGRAAPRRLGAHRPGSSRVAVQGQQDMQRSRGAAGTTAAPGGFDGCCVATRLAWGGTHGAA